ncbi:MAG: hypothetical protein AAFR66_24660, partial [Bacteroidota bacterium]
MSLLIVSLIGILTWLLCDKVLIPIFKNMSFRNSKIAEITKVGWIAGLGYVRKLGLIAGFVYAGLWVFLKVMDGFAFLFRDSYEIVSGFFEFLIGVNETLNSIDETKFIIVFISLSIIFILLITRNARIHARSVYDRLHKDHSEDNLPQLEATYEMNELTKEINKLGKDLKEISVVPIETLDPKKQQEHIARLRFLEKEIPVLKNKLKKIDISRRIFPELNQEEEIDQEKNVSLRDKIYTFFTSRGLVRSLYKTSRTIG